MVSEAKVKARSTENRLKRTNKQKGGNHCHLGVGSGNPPILEPKSSVFEIALVNLGGGDT